MGTNYPLVITKQYQEESVKWIKAIKRRENVLVTFIPKTDRLLRMQQLLENPDATKPILGDVSKYIFQVFEVGLQNLEDKLDLQFHIAGKLNYTRLLAKPLTFDQWLDYFQKNQINLVLVIPQIEKLWSVEGQAAQTSLSYMVDQYHPIITTLSLSEVDMMHPEVRPYLPDSMRLYENSYRYPLYSNEDALIFMRYMQNKWNLDLKESVKERLIEDCGGHFWLLKEAIRQCDADSYPLYPGEGLKFRLDVIYKLLLDSEQSVISKLVRGKQNFTEEEKHSYECLQKMNVIGQDNKLKIGLYNDYILNNHDAKTDLTLKDGHLVLNQIPLEKFFSRKEYRVMKILLEKRGEVVTRDEIAKRIWPLNTQDNYSDWAIDQLIARVRRRLQHLSLSPKLLQAVRGKGYLLKLS